MDNYGAFYSLDTRWGGECEGITTVYNWTADGSVSFEGGFAWFYNDFAINCVVYYHQFPRLTVLSDLMSCPINFKNNVVWKKSAVLLFSKTWWT